MYILCNITLQIFFWTELTRDKKGGGERLVLGMRRLPCSYWLGLGGPSVHREWRSLHVCVFTEHPQDLANDLPCCHRRQNYLSRWESTWLHSDQSWCLVQEHCHKREDLTDTLVGLAHSPLLVNKPLFGGGYTETNSLIHGKVSQCQMSVTIFACGHLESLQF